MSGRFINFKKLGDEMDFGEALKAMKDDKRITRPGLIGMWIALEDYPGWRQKALVLMNLNNLKKINYKADSTDLLAEDWKVIDDLQEVNVITETIEYCICPVYKTQMQLHKNAYTVCCNICKTTVILKRG